MNKFIKEEKLWMDGTDITNCLTAHVLNVGELCCYDKDSNKKFFNINEDETVTCEDALNGKNATIAPRIIPQFFNIIGKGKTKKEQLKNIIKQEENYIIQLFKASSEINKINFCKELSTESIKILFDKISIHYLSPEKFLVQKKYCNNFFKEIDITEDFKYYLFNTELIFDKRFKNMAFAIADPEFVGVRSLSHFGISKKKGSKGKLYCHEALSIIYPKAIACMEVKG